MLNIKACLQVLGSTAAYVEKQVVKTLCGSRGSWM